MVRLLKHIVNSDRRAYYIEQVNAPLAWLITKYADRYPEPARDGEGKVLHPNSLILLGLRDKFFECWHTRPNTKLYEALWKVVIVKYEHSPNWRHFLDWGLMMIQKSNWKPWNPNRQMHCWRKT